MKTKQATLGFLVIVAGILVLLSNINIEPARDFLEHWWPLAIIIAGLYTLWNDPHRYVWPLIIVTVGGSMLLNTLNVANVQLDTLIVPLILLGIGITIITNSRGNRRSVRETTAEDIVAILGGSSTKNTSDDYNGGAATAIMGGVELDLSKAKIRKGAVLHISVIMGGIDLRVAEDVIVLNRTQAILGGIEVKGQPAQSKTAPVLTIEGQIIMGGVDIKR